MENTNESFYRDFLGSVLDVGEQYGTAWVNDKFSSPIAPNEQGNADNAAGQVSNTTHSQPNYWGSFGSFGIGQNVLIVSGAALAIILLLKLR